VPVADGGACAASTPLVECAPTGYVAVETGVDSSMITSVAAETDVNTRQALLIITLNEAGREMLSRLTAPMPSRAYPLNALAIVVDGTMVNNGTVLSALTNGQIQVSGGRLATDPGYRADLANLINTGHVTPFKVTSRSAL
jgi:preprotein translocase subunit SecD